MEHDFWKGVIDEFAVDSRYLGSFRYIAKLYPNTMDHDLLVDFLDIVSANYISIRFSY
jgi:hypothetical protein